MYPIRIPEDSTLGSDANILRGLDFTHHLGVRRATTLSVVRAFDWRAGFCHVAVADSFDLFHNRVIHKILSEPNTWWESEHIRGPGIWAAIGVKPTISAKDRDRRKIVGNFLAIDDSIGNDRRNTVK